MKRLMTPVLGALLWEAVPSMQSRFRLTLVSTSGRRSLLPRSCVVGWHGGWHRG